LFHDSDGAVSSSRGIWRDKHQSMINGFTVEGYENFSVPMMPKPKSEAWLICALKEHAYQHCDALEDMPGNDDSPNGLKKLQFKILGEEPNTIDINERLRSKEIDIEQIIMPSFEALKSSVKDAVENALKIKEV
jgi:hypothetical protein